MQQISEALPRTQIIPQDFRHICDNSKSPERHVMQEADKIRPKQENIIVKEGGRLIIF